MRESNLCRTTFATGRLNSSDDAPARALSRRSVSGIYYDVTDLPEDIHVEMSYATPYGAIFIINVLVSGSW